MQLWPKRPSHSSFCDKQFVLIGGWCSEIKDIQLRENNLIDLMSTLKNISVSGRQTAKTKDSRHFGKNDRVLTSDLNSKRDGL